MTRNGADDLLALSKKLKAMGQTELRKELHKAVRDAAKPLIPKVKEAARAKLPRSGGMNEHYARKRYRAQTRTGVQTAGVRIVAPKTDPRVDEQGRVAHPVFGRRDIPKEIQTVPGAKGFFSETLRQEGPEVRDEVLEVIRDYTIRTLRMTGR